MVSAIIFSAYCNFLFPALSLNISIPSLIGTSTLSTNKIIHISSRLSDISIYFLVSREHTWVKGGVIMQSKTRKRGSTWSYYFNLGMVDGKRKRRENRDFKTNKEAQEALKITLNEYEICCSVVDESNITTADYFDYWYKEYVLINCEYNTQEYYKRIIKNHIKPYLCVYKLKPLTPAILQEFINQKDLSELSKSSIDNFHRVLSEALKSVVYPYQFIKENPK